MRIPTAFRLTVQFPEQLNSVRVTSTYTGSRLIFSLYKADAEAI